MNCGNLLLEIDVRRELVQRLVLRRGMSIPHDLLALLAHRLLHLFLLLPLLLVDLRAEDIHTRTGERLERGLHVRAALQLRELRLARFVPVSLFLPPRIQQLDTHVLLQLVDGDLQATDGTFRGDDLAGLRTN